MAEPLGLVGFGDAANVLLEGFEAQIGAGGDKGLLGHVEAGIKLARQLPGQRDRRRRPGPSFRRARVTGWPHAHVGHVDDAAFGDDGGSIGDVVSDHDGVGVERLRQFERAGAGRLESLGKAEVVEGIEAIGAAHRREAGRGKAAAQERRGGFANPFEARLAGAVVEGENQENAVFAGGCGGASAGLGACDGAWRNGSDNDKSRKANEGRKPDPAKRYEE